MEGKESLERIFAQLSDEQKEQFKNCKDMDEVMKLANEENVELNDEQLEFIASGGCSHDCVSISQRPEQLSEGWRVSGRSVLRRAESRKRDERRRDVYIYTGLDHSARNLQLPDHSGQGRGYLQYDLFRGDDHCHCERAV